MSGLSDFFTEGAFWWGAGAGTVLGACITSGINFWNTHRSDTRTFDHEDDLDQRKADREQEERNQAIVFEAATSFATVCSEILESSVDVKGLFNALRDAYHDERGTPDPKADEKLMFAETTMSQTMRIQTPFNTLKMVAPVALLERATQLSAAIIALTKTTTEPFAKPLVMKTAADELDKFINAFRREYGREEYPPSKAQADAMSFMKTLQKQVSDYMEEAKADMRAAGFRTTPWDHM